MSVHRMIRNDTRPYFRVVLKIAGTPVDLEGASVQFHMKDESGIVVVDTPAVVVQTDFADTGAVEWRPTPAQTGVSGTYTGEWEATFVDGSVQTFPTNGIDKILIRDDVA